VSIKYSVITLSAFERLAASPLGTSIWGRFCQPVQLVRPKNSSTEERILRVLSQCVGSLSEATTGLVEGSVTAPYFFTEGLAQSYRTELRAERPYERARDIVDSNQLWFSTLMTALHGAPNADGLYTVTRDEALRTTKAKWFARRITGKPITVLRIMKATLTFEQGVDYALDKLEKHSGVRLQLTSSQRKRPLLWSPVLLWKAVRSGAWR
jgi:hypothetical protein